MGSSSRRNSTRAAKARSVKGTSQSRHRATGRPAAQTKPRIPAAIEIAIDAQRDSLGTAITLLYCLHSALRRETADAGPEESEAVKDAAEWADVTDITAMLVVRLHAVHSALDPVALGQANPDPEMVMLIEQARKLGIGNDQREAS